jgi:hypothetical protein
MKRLVHQPTTPGQGIVYGVEPNVKVKLNFGGFFSPPTVLLLQALQEA